jgi:hypothetical protein
LVGWLFVWLVGFAKLVGVEKLVGWLVGKKHV